RRLIEMNANGQRLHTSMELEPDFAGTGKAYLMGLAVTDEPASLGTSQLQLFKNSSRKNQYPVLISEPTEILQFTDTEQTAEQSSNQKYDESFFQWFKKRLSKELKKPNDPLEDDYMTEEQFKTLKDQGEKQAEAVEKLTNLLEDKFANATFTAKPETGKETTGESGEEGKILAAVEKISDRLTAVETQLSKAVAGKPATEKPAGTGAGELTEVL
ncbi:MAG: GPO family capsid scaffolding protein, partial [Gammaproteobacteria bacterium]|nr:GPO family capsid scaffolding protein [Gammaproteobacteria bacterium]